MSADPSPMPVESALLDSQQPGGPAAIRTCLDRGGPGPAPPARRPGPLKDDHSSARARRAVHHTGRQLTGWPSSAGGCTQLSQP